MRIEVISEADRFLKERAVEGGVLAVSNCVKIKLSTKVVMMIQC